MPIPPRLIQFVVNTVLTYGVRYWNSGGKEQVFHFAKKTAQQFQTQASQKITLKEANEIIGITTGMSEQQIVEKTRKMLELNAMDHSSTPFLRSKVYAASRIIDEQLKRSKP